MKMTVQIDEELGRKFMAKVIEVKGNKKGALSEAIEEAVKLWLEKHDVKFTSINVHENRYYFARHPGAQDSWLISSC